MTNCLQDISSYVMFVSLLVLGILTSPVVTYTKPHIVMVVADDLGWDDVSFHGSNQIPTPTLDRFAREGVILNNYYVSPLSTPSRAAFMTGKYASHLGLQHDDFHNQQPAGLPLTETILPNRLRELGYSARGVGKWHLGFFAKEYTPTYRGFDSFFGFWTDTEDYFSHVSYDNGYGLDLRRDLQLVYNESGSYSTELFTKEAKGIIERYDGVKPLFLYVAHQAVHVGNGDDPLQVPEKYVKQFAGIKDVSRRKFAGMITTVDESLKIISEALTKKDMMKNTIIVFTTDNGAAAGGYENSAGSNYPLRGSKNTFWEGGVRGVGFVYSPLLQTKGRTCDELIHATDWLPTLYAAGGGNILSLGKIDGYNVWDTLSTGSPSPRFEVLHGVDTMLGASGALRVGDYKLIVNLDDTYYGDWYPRPGTPVPIGTNKRKRRQLLEGTTVDCTIREPHPLLFTHAPVCKPREKPCLFNIKWDPCEYHNIGEIMPNTMKVMLERFYHFANSSASPIYPESDNSSRPDLHDGSWTFWRDNPQMPLTNPHFVYPDPMRDLKLNDHGGSSAPYNPPDNEKIFKEKAKHAAKPLTNVTMNTTINGKHETYNVSTPHKVFLHHDKTKLPASLTHPLSTTHHDHPPHSPHQVEPPELTNKAPPTIQKVRPNVIIEGIGNLIDTKHPPKLLTPTEGPFLPDTTKAPSIQFLPTTNTPFSSNLMTTTELPSIDIQNMLMDEIGSGLYPTIAPTKEFMLPTKPPNSVKNMKPLSLGEVISGRPASSKTSGDKSIGAKLQTNEMKIDLPQVYDVIDETDNLPENQGLTGNVPNIYDVVDLNQQGTKATSKQQPHHKGHNEPGSEMWTIAEKAPESKPKSPPPQSPLSSFFKPTGKPEPHIIKAKPVVETPERIPPAVHNFEGDIIMDGHKFHVKGTETGDNEWLMQDAPSHQSPRILKPATPKPKSKVPIKKPAGKDGSEDAPDYSEVIDVIDESPKEERKADEYKKVQQALEKTVDHVSEKKAPKPVSKRVKAVNKLVEKENGKNVSVPHVHGNGTGITKKNDTNCEKPVQLESSDNAVVVSSVVIVVIASAMVVGVALVAMIAVVARHFQRTKSQDGGGAS